MRRREAAAFALILALVGAGCSRSLSSRPIRAARAWDRRPNRSWYKKDTPASRRAFDARNALALSEERLRRATSSPPRSTRAGRAEGNDPNSSDAYTLLAVIADGQGQPAQAGQHYKRASELAPTEAACSTITARGCAANGRAPDSLAWFDHALQAPGYATPAAALANSGRCALDVGGNDRAAATCAQALEKDPRKAGRPRRTRAPAVPFRPLPRKHARSPNADWRLPRRTPKR